MKGTDKEETRGIKVPVLLLLRLLHDAIIIIILVVIQRQVNSLSFHLGLHHTYLI